MQDYQDVVASAGDRVISAISGAQDAIVSAVSQVTSTVGSFIPPLPALPLADALPQPKELVATGFDFAERLLESQKTYALALFDALSPVTGKVVPAKATKRASTRKTTTANA